MSINRLYAMVAILAALVGSSAPAHAAPPSVTCAACFVVDDTGRVLLARNPDTRLPNASTTKMATALLVRRETTLSTKVPVSPKAAGVGMGGLDLHAGETYTVRALLYALLLTSSNEAAVALAEHVGGSEFSFVEDMNVLVYSLGARDTHFATSHGLDTPQHYSTARDLATIAGELLADPVLEEIVATPRTTIPGPRGDIVVENRNPLLETYRGAVGVKTGFTNAAGNVLVAAAQRRGRTIITVAMDSTDAARDSRLLLDYAFARLRRTILVAADDAVAAIVFDPGGAIGVAPAEPVRGFAAPDDVETLFVPASETKAPVTEGERVGTLVVRASGRELATVDAFATTTADGGASEWLVEILAGALKVLGALLGKPGA